MSIRMRRAKRPELPLAMALKLLGRRVNLPRTPQARIFSRVRRDVQRVRELLANREVRNDERGGGVAIVSGDDTGHIGRAMGHEFRSQWPTLIQVPVASSNSSATIHRQEAMFGIVLVEKPQRVAELVVPLLRQRPLWSARADASIRG